MESARVSLLRWAWLKKSEKNPDKTKALCLNGQFPVLHWNSIHVYQL